MARPPRGDEPMQRAGPFFMPQSLIDSLNQYAATLSMKEKKSVTQAEALRRILERALKRRTK